MKQNITIVLICLVSLGILGTILLSPTENTTPPTASQKTDNKDLTNSDAVPEHLSDEVLKREKDKAAIPDESILKRASAKGEKPSLEGDNEEEKEEFGQISGRVEDIQGNPIEGCMALFYLTDQRSAAMEKFIHSSTPEFDAATVTSSNSEGQLPATDLPTGTYCIVWSAPGYALATSAEPVAVEANQTVTIPEQRLEHGGIIVGQVLEIISSKPIAGATVTANIITSNMHTAAITADHKNIKVHTDEQGNFILDMLLQNERYDLTAEHPQYVKGEEKGVEVDSDRPVKIILKRGGTIEGMVLLEEDKSPVKNARVYASSGGKFEKKVRSATDGIFVIEGLPTGNYDLHATSGKYRSEIKKALSVSWQKKQSGIELLLKPGREITGVVREKTTQKPLEGATVKADLEEYAATTQANGSYKLQGVPPGKMELTASAVGYVEVKTSIGAAGEQTMQCNFELEQGGEVDVLVTDGEDNPIAEVQVIAVQGMEAKGTPQQTDVNGHALIKDISLASPPMIVAVKEGYEIGMPSTPKFQPGQSSTEHHIILKKSSGGGVFTGRVSDESGQPIAGATVKWFSMKSPSTSTDSEGKYRLEVESAGLMAIMSNLNAQADGYAPESKSNVKPGSSEEPTEVNFTLKPGHWLELLVVNQQDESLQDVMVSVLSGGFPPLPIPGLESGKRTGEDGRIRFESLPAPEVKLMLNKDGLTPIEMKTVAVDQEHTLVMLSKGVIRGKVLDKETKEPVSSFAITLSGGGFMGMLPGSSSKESFNAADGTFTFDDLNQQSNYKLTVEASGYSSEVEEIIAADPDEQGEENIIYLSRGQLLGVVYDASTKKPISGVTVVYANHQDFPYFDWNNLTESNFALSGVQSTMSGADGTFSFTEGTEKGSIFAKAEGYEKLMVRPEARDLDTSGMLRVALKKGASVVGQYHDRGVPVQGATLVLMRKPLALQGNMMDNLLTDPVGVEQVGQSVTEEQGNYLWEDLAAGRYQLIHQELTGGMGIFRLGITFELEAGEQKTVNLGDGLGSSSLSGRILDDQGNALTGNILLTLAPSFDWEYSDFGTLTDTNGGYMVEGLLDGPYKASLLKVSLSGGSLYTNMTRNVEVSGDTVQDFVFSTGKKVTASLAFPEDTPQADKTKYMSAVLLAVNVEQSSQEEYSAFGHCLIQGEKLSFQGRFNGEYKIKISSMTGTSVDVTGTFKLNNLQADQDLGALSVEL